MEIKKLQNYIDGEWIDSLTKDFVEIRNPARDTLLCLAPMSVQSEVGAAVRAAQKSFADWKNTPPVSRARYLLRLIALLEDNFDELSVVQTKEHGKTIDESRGETRRGIEMVEVAAGIPSLMQGTNLEDVASGMDECLINEPMGVFGGIAPFNFPFMVPLWFIPFAIACGNTFVLKPSPRTPMSQVELFRLMDEAGIPPGVVNLVHGGAETADALIEHPLIQGITFVGSTPVAKQIYRKCGDLGKRVIAQAGAKNFVVVMPDAEVDQTLVSLITSFFGNTGQRCLAGANLLVVGDDSFYRTFVDRFVEMAAGIKVGDGLDESVQMGPLQNVESKKRVLAFIAKGINEGAELILDGRKLNLVGDVAETCFLNPSVFENVTPDMTLAKEEIFGPVASIIKAKDLSESIDMINACPYGNAASIFTNTGKWARRFQHEVVAGNIGINVGIAAPMAFFPFGGRKDSFFGVLHGQGRDVIRFFTEPKILITRWF
ncbi:MAG: CoA-acylating methylmalonate-semialdehyde dehydrogenase [Candidatus Aminicenantes bacterium]|nr:CoA-acylating methylmalonate-semialdehyde dehydrogenase [Candidatus Aminicenantes bacterium]